MRIKAYVRLQKCTTSDRRAFVQRYDPCHGVAKGRIDYYAVEAGSWAGIRRVLKTFDVIGHSEVCAKNVQAWANDIGQGYERLTKLVVQEVPDAARWVGGNRCLDRSVAAPELTSFGNQAVPRLWQPKKEAAGAQN